MVAGCKGLGKIILHPVCIVNIAERQRSKADDGVHGGADIVGCLLYTSTGGSSGIGRCTASALKENGCIVYEFSRRNIPMEGVTHLSVDAVSYTHLKCVLLLLRSFY